MPLVSQTFSAIVKSRGRNAVFSTRSGKKKGVHDSFCAAHEDGTFRREGKRAKLHVVGWMRMREALRFEGVANYVTVAREGDRWAASILVEAPEPTFVCDDCNASVDRHENAATNLELMDASSACQPVAALWRGSETAWNKPHCGRKIAARLPVRRDIYTQAGSHRSIGAAASLLEKKEVSR
jgi:hypothetical protein